jgi:hypothetical protein
MAKSIMQPTESPSKLRYTNCYLFLLISGKNYLLSHHDRSVYLLTLGIFLALFVELPTNYQSHAEMMQRRLQDKDGMIDKVGKKNARKQYSLLIMLY